MKKNYPISSQELNDIILTAYGDLCYLLGYTDSDNNNYSGLYDGIELSGVAYLATSSGIPHIGTNDSKYELGLNCQNTTDFIVNFLKYDYIYRKDRGFIKGN